jgi:dynein heavy chain, axonemal
LRQCRRYNYTTPTSFLELISFYKNLLGNKTAKITDQISRLEIGLETMNTTTTQVAELQKLLDVKMVEVEVKKEATDKLIDVVSAESGAAQIEEDAAKIQADSTNELAAQANETKAAANKELEEAVPAMKEAEDAVACLEVKAIQELKSLQNPPPDCLLVTKAVLILRGERKNHAWNNAQKMMGNPKAFLDQIKSYDGDNIDEKLLGDVAPILALENFTYENMLKKSSAAANLCKWVINIVRYNSIFKKVKPLMESADAAEKLANEKLAELQIVLEKVKIIVDKVNELKQKLDEANTEKQAVVDNAEKLASQLGLANRLVNGLADERVRWMANVATFKLERLTMIGNALVSAAFVSYIGPFNSQFRGMLWQE